MYPLSGRAIAEFIGTLALIFIGAGSILADRLSGGEVSLVGNFRLRTLFGDSSRRDP